MNSNIFNEVNSQPKADIAICSKCGWRGPVSECNVAQQGDWEYGYYEVHECPVCEDGGCIDNYSYSPELVKKYNDWF